MPNATLQAITAAGVVYQLADFADPKLTQPTALTVTADGRVFGHLADWNSSHIGFDGQRVTPPRSRADYRYFHQGVVRTNDGDLPVGKITLGTGHAALGENANTAAAHYDNTGSVVAAVRAGEDAYGIWLSGRLVPGVTDAKVDELRLSGVSGDWRGIDGNLELVAALAVNVPGFPLPRTEQLVAAGGFGALVAAGVVLHPETQMPKTPAELDAHITAAMDQRDRVFRRKELSARMSLVASASKRDRLTRQVATVRRQRARDKVLVAAGGVTAALIRTPAGAERYNAPIGTVIGRFTSKEGDTVEVSRVDGGTGVGDRPANRYVATIDGQEVADLTTDKQTGLILSVDTNPEHQGEGIARGLYEQAESSDKVLHVPEWGRTEDGEQFVQSVGGDVMDDEEAADILGVDLDVVRPSEDLYASAVRRASGYCWIVAAAGPPKAPTAPTAPGQKGPGKKGERRVVSEAGARRYGVSVGDLIGQDVANAAKAVDDVKNRAGEYAQAAGRDLASLITGKPAPAPKPAAPKPPAPPKPEAGVIDAPKPTSSTPPAEFPDAPEPRMTNTDSDPAGPMLEDESPMTGARGGKLIDFADGVATYDDGTQTDGKTWSDIGDAGVAKILDAQAANKANTQPATPADTATTIVTPDTEPAPRAANNSGDPTSRMEEDEAPATGKYGGNLVSYDNGVAVYDDGTSTDGTAWKDEPTPLTNKPFTQPTPAPAPEAPTIGGQGAVADPNKKKEKDLVAAAIARINALDGRPKG